MSQYNVYCSWIYQINCDDYRLYGDTRKVKKDYYVQEEDGELIVNTAYKDGNQYVQHVRNGQSCDKLLVEQSKVYNFERYYQRNKSFPGIRHVVMKVKNVDKIYYEDFFCVVCSYDKSVFR